jgi:hypothetical protein
MAALSASLRKVCVLAVCVILLRDIKTPTAVLTALAVTWDRRQFCHGLVPHTVYHGINIAAAHLP